jgi:hypothetical protein
MNTFDSSQEITNKTSEFIILRDNSVRKCSICGAIEQIMYVSDKILCGKCCTPDFKIYKKKINRSPGKIESSLNADKLGDLYYHQQKSLQDIANEYNCTRQTVKLLMEKYDLQRRQRSKARVLAIKKGKFEQFKYDDINEDFFSEWTPQMAWILGLLFTDGNVQRTKGQMRISISSVDYNLLEKVKKLLGSNKPINEKKQSYDKSKIIYGYEFYRKKMRDDLHELGLLERKSLNMQFPKVPEEYIRHFIRGCWDGDGTVYLTKENINAQYVCGSEVFIKRLVDELSKIGINRTRNCYMRSDELQRLRQIYSLNKYPLRISVDYRSKNISYSIKLNSRDNIEKLFHFFYDGVDESIYLTRKYKVFLKGLRLEDVVNKNN